MAYEQPTIETYGSIEALTEQMDDSYGGPGNPPPSSGGDA